MILMWLYYFLFLVCYYCVVIKAMPSGDNVISKENSKSTEVYLDEIKSTIMSSNNERKLDITENLHKVRVKRQSSGAGKFEEASKMPQIKLVRLILQMFKNSWDLAYVGGSHPLHPNVPKAIVALYKQKIVEFFIPDVGEDPNKPRA